MKQLLQYMRNGETVVADVPTPTPRPGMALVRTAASLVSSGTGRMVVEFAEKNLVEKAQARPDLVAQVMDKVRREGLLTAMEATFNRLDQPMALGYSSAGTVVETGPGLQGFRVGDRVACAGGGYAVHAEYAAVPHNLIAKLPDSVDFESAAFATVGAVAMHGVRLSQVQLGAQVAVIGLGLLGLLAAEIALAAGCEVLGIDLNPERVALAHKLGAEAVQRPQAEEAALAFSRGRGVDAILICADTSSDDPVELAGAIARDRAKVVAVGAVGLNIPRKLYYEKELDLIVSRSYGPGRYDPGYEESGVDYPIGYVRWTEGRNLEAFIDLLASGKLDVHPLISHRFPIEQAPQAYSLITGKQKEPFLGVVLTYPDRALPIGFDHRVPNPQAATIASRPGELLTLGVLGAGNYASAVFLPNMRRAGGVAPVGIASASGVNAQHASHRFGFGYATSSEEHILTDPAINTVAILTRHQDHARQVQAALRAGKHVYCEKPLAITQDQLDEIAALLKEENLPLLAVGFNRRFAPLARQLKGFIDLRRGPLYADYRVNAGYLPPKHWLHDPQQGGGRIIGEGCHFVDFLTFLVGALPLSISAVALPDDGRYREDNVILSLAYPDGSLGVISYLANGDRSIGKERLEVFSNGRVAMLDDFRSLELARGGKRQVLRSRLQQDKGHRAAWQAFLAAIKAGGPPPIPYEELVGVTRATLAAMESLHHNAPYSAASASSPASSSVGGTDTSALSRGPGDQTISGSPLPPEDQPASGSPLPSGESHGPLGDDEASG
jgi:predicted dehydrogenase